MVNAAVSGDMSDDGLEHIHSVPVHGSIERGLELIEHANIEPGDQECGHVTCSFGVRMHKERSKKCITSNEGLALRAVEDVPRRV